MELAILIVFVGVLLLLAAILLRQNQALIAERARLAERSERTNSELEMAGGRLEDAEARARAAETQVQTARLELDHRAARCEEHSADLQKQLEIHQKLTAEHQQSCTDYAKIKGQYEHLEKQLAERDAGLQKEIARLQEQFKISVNDLMDIKARALKADSRESVNEVLAPVKEQLTAFAKRVNDLGAESNRQHGSLIEKLATVERLNETLTAEAHALSQALRGNAKVMGDWGEVTLERVLQAAGLSAEMYSKQEHMPAREGDNGALRADFVIQLPDKRHIVIDSKVSLSAYVDYTHAETDEARAQAADRLLESLQAHVQKLAESEYHQRIESPEFTFMFVPHDPIFNLAVQREPNLVSKAYQKRVLMVTPSTLVVALKVVSELWQRDRAARSQQRLIDLAGNIYNKLHDAIGDLERVGKSLDTAKGAYESAINRLASGRGNVIKSADEIKKIGDRKVKVTKSLEDSFPTLYADAMEEEETPDGQNLPSS